MLAEVPAPDPVDPDPRGQRTSLSDDLVGKLHASRALLEGSRLAPLEHAQKPPRDDLARIGNVATDEDRQVPRLAGAQVHPRHGGR